MKIFQLVVKINCLVILSLFLFYCAASHKVKDELKFKDAGFNYSQLQNNGLVVVGVSSQVVNLNREDRVKYSSILSNVLLKEIKGSHNIRLINTIQFINQMGKQLYFTMMDTFDIRKSINNKIIQTISDSIPTANYALFVFIENENIIDQSFDEYITDDDGEKKLETEYKKTYLLTIEFQMYDLEQRKIVWNNIIYNEAGKTETRTARTGCVEGCIDNTISNILFGKAAEINREEVLEKIAVKFAKGLQKAK